MRLFTLIILLLFFVVASKAQEWEQTGPEWGTINCFLSDGNNFFAGTENGVFLSVDEGNSYQDINDSLSKSSIISLAKRGKTIFALNDEGKIFFTDNYGKTWTPLNSDILGFDTVYYDIGGYPEDEYFGSAARYYENKIESIVAKGNEIFAVGASKLLHLKDNKEWELISDTLERIQKLFVVNQKFFRLASNYPIVQISEDNGKNWSPLKLGVNNLLASWIDVDNNYALAIVEKSEDEKAKAFFYSPIARKWLSINDLPFVPVNFSIIDNVIFVSTNNYNCYRSTNLGKSWVEIPIKWVNQFEKHGRYIFAATPTGIYRSSDQGISWEKSNNGINKARTRNLLKIDKNLVSRVDDRVLLYDNNKWTEIYRGQYEGELAVNGNTLFVMDPDKGIFRSMDKGKNWELLNIGLSESPNFTALAAKENHIWLGTEKIGILHSSDNGSTWTTENVGLPEGINISKISKIGKKLFLLSSKGTYYSEDNGKTWKPEPIKLSSLDIVSLASKDSIILAGTDYSGVYISKDKGENWVYSGLEGKKIVSVAACKNIMLAGTKEYGLFFSDDDGKSWKKAEIPGETILEIIVNENRILCRTENKIATESWDFGRYYVSKYYVLGSTDEGLTWTNILGLSKEDIYCMANVNNRIYALGKTEFYYSDDEGNSWKIVNKNFTNGSITAIAAFNNIIYASTGRKLFFSFNNENLWTPIKFDHDDVIKQIAVNNNNIYVALADSYDEDSKRIACSSDTGKTWVDCGNNGLPAQVKIKSIHAEENILCVITNEDNVFISADQGKTWKNAFEQGEKNYTLSQLNATCFAQDKNLSFAGTLGEGIFRSDDNGKSWKKVNNGLGITEIKSIEICGNNILALGNDFGYGQYYGRFSKVFVSKNKGDSWEIIETFQDSIMIEQYKRNEVKWYNDVYQMAAIENSILMNTWHRLYVSHDQGLNWDSLLLKFKNNQDPGKQTPNALISNNHSFFMATAEAGILRSQDKGESWEKINSGLTDMTITCLTASGDTIFASSPSGIFRSTNNGNNWELLEKNPELGSIGFIKILKSILYIGCSEGLFYSENYGSTFQRLGYISSWPKGNIAAYLNYLFALDVNQNIFYSADKGNSWRIVPKLLEQTERNRSIKNLSITKDQITLLNNRGIKHSNNFEKGWQSTNFYNKIPLKNGFHEEMAMFGVTKNNLFIGTRHFGVLHSKDNGATWNNLTNGLPDFTEDSWTIASGLATCEKKLFIGITCPESFVGEFMSNDNGRTWKLVDNGLQPNAAIFSLVKHKKKYFAATSKGLFISSDKGKHWSKENTSALPNNFINEIQSDKKNLFAIVKPENPEINYSQIRHENGKIYLETSNGKLNIGGLYSSKDNGVTWNEINLKNKNTYINSFAISDKNIILNVFEMDSIYEQSNQTDRYVTEWRKKITSKIILSTDNGKSWTWIREGLPEDVLINKFLVTEKFIFIATEANGMMRSDNNGKTWREINTGLNELRNWDGNFISINHLAIAEKRLWSLSKKLYYSDDYGDSWLPAEETDNAIPDLVSAYTSTEKNMFAYGYNDTFNKSDGKLWISDDKGLTWKIAKNTNSSNDVWDFTVNENKVVSTTEDGKKNSPLKLPGNRKFSIISSGNLWLAQNSNGKTEYYSKDGDSWKEIGAIFSSTKIKTIATDGNTVYVGNENGIICSNDNGQNWNYISTNNLSVEAIAAHGDTVAYCGYDNNSNRSIYVSTDRGKNWKEFNKGLFDGKTEIKALQISEGYLYAATRGESVLTLKLD